MGTEARGKAGTPPGSVYSLQFLRSISNPVPDNTCIARITILTLITAPSSGTGRCGSERTRAISTCGAASSRNVMPDYSTVRIRAPAGVFTIEQLRGIARIAKKYGNGIVHCTTRQTIEIPHVSPGILKKSQRNWSKRHPGRVREGRDRQHHLLPGLRTLQVCQY